MSMEQDETNTIPYESYTGDQIDSIDIIGSKEAAQEIKIFLKDNNCITILARMGMTETGITPRIVIERGKWGRVGGGVNEIS